MTIKSLKCQPAIHTLKSLDRFSLFGNTVEILMLLDIRSVWTQANNAALIYHER